MVSGTICRAISLLSASLNHVIFFVQAFLGPRAELAARLLASGSRLPVCKRRIEDNKDPKPRFTQAFRLLWIVLSKVWGHWEQAVHLMQPATVKKWHTRAFRQRPTPLSSFPS